MRGRGSESQSIDEFILNCFRRDSHFALKGLITEAGGKGGAGRGRKEGVQDKWGGTRGGGRVRRGDSLFGNINSSETLLPLFLGDLEGWSGGGRCGGGVGGDWLLIVLVSGFGWGEIRSGLVDSSQVESWRGGVIQVEVTLGWNRSRG